MSCDDKVPAPPTIDPSKVKVHVGDQVLTPQVPVAVGATGYFDGIPTPGIELPQDPFAPGGINGPSTQPTAQQYQNWAQRVPINADAFVALIQAQSPNVIWEKAALCPNRQENGDHDPTCKLCLHGVLFFDPQKVSMLITGASLQQTFFIQGRFNSGSVMVTAVPANPISYGDRITIMNNFIRDSELRRRTQKTLVDPMKYPVQDVLLLRTGSKVYNKGSDFSVTPEGFIEWTTVKSRRPKDGEFYTIVYKHWPVYILTEMVHHHRDRRVKQGTAKDQTVTLPIQGIAKLDFLVRDESKDAQETEYASPFAGA